MSPCDVTWLPPLHELTGEWSVYCEQLYAIFCRDFMEKPLATSFRGRTVSAPWRQDVASDGKSGTFWHLVSEGGKELDRLPDPRRCERLAWIRCVVEGVDKNSHVLCWRDESRGDTRWKLALSDFSYLVILGDHGTYCRLITAYFLKRDHEREKLSNEHSKARANNGVLLKK